MVSNLLVYYFKIDDSAVLNDSLSLSEYCLCNFSNWVKSLFSASVDLWPLSCFVNLFLTSDLIEDKELFFADPCLNFSKISFKCLTDSFLVSVVTGGNGTFKVNLLDGST